MEKYWAITEKTVEIAEQLPSGVPAARVQLEGNRPAHTANLAQLNAIAVPE